MQALKNEIHLRAFYARASGTLAACKRKLAGQVRQQGGDRFTPEDWGLTRDVTQAELDAFLQDNPMDDSQRASFQRCVRSPFTLVPWRLRFGSGLQSENPELEQRVFHSAILKILHSKPFLFS